MSTNFVTAAGFVKKTLAELKTFYEELFQSVFGNTIDLDPSGSFGQIIGLLSKRDADLFDGAEEIYNSRNVGAATGVSLDNILAENGLVRIDASETLVSDVYLYGSEGTVVASGKKARQSSSTTLFFSLQTSVEITKDAARFITLEPDAPAGGGGTVYTVTIDSTLYSYTSIIGDSKDDVIDALVILITAGSWAGTASNNGDTALQLELTATDFVADWSATWTLALLASGGDFLCDVEGANTVPANTLTIIVTPVSGWDALNNPAEGVTGREVETDAEFRIRNSQVGVSGTATDEAIQTAILRDVENVSYCRVYSNRNAVVDGEGRPGKSFEAVCQGGLDAEIGEKIWETQPAGIESYGNTSVTVLDSNGASQTVEFSRPVQIYIHVLIQRDYYSEEEYPADGDALIKQAIVDWAAANQTIGKDVIRLRLATPVYEIPGIGDIEIFLDSTPNPGDTPTFLEQDIVIGNRENSSWDVSRITIQDMP